MVFLIACLVVGDDKNIRGHKRTEREGKGFGHSLLTSLRVCLPNYGL